MPTAKQATIDQEGNNNTTSTNVGNATNTNNNKRKDVSLATNNNIVDTKNVIQNVNSGGASSTNKRQRPSDEDDSSSLDDSCSKEISVVDILFPIEGPELPEETLRALASKQGWVFGIGQRNIATIQRVLFDRYNKLDNGVDKLKEDIAAINNGEYSSDSDSDDELEEINKKSLVATEEDDWDFSFDNDGDDESTNGTTDGLGESSTSIPPNVPPLHDNAQSSTTTTTLKLDISCIENGVKDDEGNGVKVNESNGVEDNRNDPSPVNVEADLSAYNNNDESPPSNNDSHDEDECYEALSPKKVNTKEVVGNTNTPTTAMSTPQTIQTSPSSAFTANLGKESEIYEDQAPSNHGMLLQQFQQQQHQLSFPPPQLESMRDEEQHLTEQIQQKEWLMQQREQQQWSLQERQIVQQWMLLQQHQLQQLKERLLHILQQQRQFAHAQQQLLQQQQQYHMITSDPLFHAMLAKGIHPTIAYTFLGQQTQSIESTEFESFEARSALQLQQQLLAQETKKHEEAAKWLLQCMNTSEVDGTFRTGSWDSDEEERLMFGIHLFGFGEWGSIQLIVLTRTTDSIRMKANYQSNMGIYLLGTVRAIDTLFTREDVKEFHDQTSSKVESVLEKIQREMVIPSPPELEKEFEEFLDSNPKKKDEWEASKRVEQAQYEAVRAATNNFKPSREHIKLWDEEYVKQVSSSCRDYVKEKYHRRYVLGEGLEGDLWSLPLMCFDLHHNSALAVEQKWRDQLFLGRSQPSELRGHELIARRSLLTMLPATEHALETWGEVPKLLSGNSTGVSRRYKAVVTFETAILGTRCTMSGEVLPDHLFDGHHRTEKCDLQEGDTVYSTAKVCQRDGLYNACPLEYIPWRDKLFNEVLKKTRLKKEWHRVLHWVLRNLDWFDSQGITIDYPYKVDGTVLVRTKPLP